MLENTIIKNIGNPNSNLKCALLYLYHDMTKCKIFNAFKNNFINVYYLSSLLELLRGMLTCIVYFLHKTILTKVTLKIKLEFSKLHILLDFLNL